MFLLRVELLLIFFSFFSSYLFIQMSSFVFEYSSLDIAISITSADFWFLSTTMIFSSSVNTCLSFSMEKVPQDLHLIIHYFSFDLGTFGHILSKYSYKECNFVILSVYICCSFLHLILTKCWIIPEAFLRSLHLESY